MARTTWVAATATKLRAELLTHGSALDQADAETFVRQARAHAAEQTRVTERTAQKYATNSVIEGWAADLMKDHPLGPASTPTPSVPAQRQRHLRVVQ